MHDFDMEMVCGPVDYPHSSVCREASFVLLGLHGGACSCMTTAFACRIPAIRSRRITRTPSCRSIVERRNGSLLASNVSCTNASSTVGDCLGDSCSQATVCIWYQNAVTLSPHSSHRSLALDLRGKMRSRKAEGLLQLDAQKSDRTIPCLNAPASDQQGLRQIHHRAEPHGQHEQQYHGIKIRDCRVQRCQVMGSLGSLCLRQQHVGVHYGRDEGHVLRQVLSPTVFFLFFCAGMACDQVSLGDQVRLCH